MKSIKLSYIVLIILIAFLGYVTYIKMTYVEKKEEVITRNINSISLSEIANNYNNKSIDVDTSASINGNTLNIIYNSKTYTFSFNNGILKLETLVDKDIDNMFVYLVDSVAIAKKINENDSIITTNLIINSLFSNDAIKVVKSDNNTMYVIDTTKDINLYKAENIYNETKILNINDTNYNMEIGSIKLINPSIKYNMGTKSFDVIGYIDNTSKNDTTIKVTLYDKEKKQVKEENVSIKGDDNTLNTNIKLDEMKVDEIIYCSYDIK